MKPGWAERHPDLAGINPTAESAAGQPPQIASAPPAQLQPPQITSAPPAQPQPPPVASAPPAQPQPPPVASAPPAQPQPSQIASAPPAQPQQPQIASTPPVPLRAVIDTLAYVRRVQDEFRDNRAKFAEFVEVLDSFTNDRITGMEVLIRLETLFDGYPKLLQALCNNFLPNNLP